MFINKQLTKEDITSGGGGGSFISKSGIYDVVLKTVSVQTNDKGTQSLNFNIEYNGNPSTIYGMYIINGKGEFLPGFKTFTQLAAIAGLVDDNGKMAVEDPEEQIHKLGKDQNETPLMVLDQFTDFPCTIRVQMEYGINPNTNQIRESKVIKSFFREDGAFSEEILAGKEIGGRLEFEKEKLADNITYKDELTPSDIEQWKANKKANRTSTASTAPKTASTARSGGLFKN